jgi:hypothetical protein
MQASLGSADAMPRDVAFLFSLDRRIASTARRAGVKAL